MGLMQLMPGTAKGYKVSNAYDPEQCVRGGAAAIRDIDKFMEKYVSDPEERRWFALASYNAGQTMYRNILKLQEKTRKFGLIMCEISPLRKPKDMQTK